MADDSDDTTPIDRVFAGGADWHLRLLVEDANDFGIEVPITLFAPGAVITGVLTSGKVYFELFAERFAASWPEEGRDAIRASMASPGEVYPRLGPGEKSPRKEPAKFIHVRDASVVDARGAPAPGGIGLLWRGRLEMVAGYSLGFPLVVPPVRKTRGRRDGDRGPAIADSPPPSPKKPRRPRSAAR
jgi:hypothetical protein